MALVREKLSKYWKKKKYLIRSREFTRGGQAKVFLGSDLDTKKLVAVKEYQCHPKSIKSRGSTCEEQMLDKEITVLRKLRKASHSLTLLDVILESDGKTRLVTEYCNGANLHQYLVCGADRSEVAAKRLVRKILVAVKEIHDLGYCHLDLKLENIIYDEISDTVKVIDFGFAEKVKSKNDQQELLLDKFCGTIHYVAPEIILQNPFLGTKSDVWAIGIITFVLVTGKFPFHSSKPEKLYKMILTKPICPPIKFSPELDDMLGSIFCNDFHKRPTVDDLLAHSWFNDA